MQRLSDDLAAQRYKFLSGLDKSYSSITRAYVLRHHIFKRRKRGRHKTRHGTMAHALAYSFIVSQEKYTERVSTPSGPTTSAQSVASTKRTCAVILPVADRSHLHLGLEEAKEEAEPLLYYLSATILLAQGRVNPFSTFARPTNNRENFLIDYCSGFSSIDIRRIH